MNQSKVYEDVLPALNALDFGECPCCFERDHIHITVGSEDFSHYTVWIVCKNCDFSLAVPGIEADVIETVAPSFIAERVVERWKSFDQEIIERTFLRALEEQEAEW